MRRKRRERRKKQEEEKEKEKKKKEKPLKIFKQGSDMIQCEHSDYCVEKELKKDMTESIFIRKLV